MVISGSSYGWIHAIRMAPSDYVASTDAINSALRVSVAPSPTASSTTLRLTLASPTEVSLSVYDALGRLVHASPSETRQAGETVIPLNTSSFSPGVYAVMVRAGEEQTTALLTVTR
ncbi:MAG: hypothetical protein Rubg2KO_20530 [Rubricoccaceae bacterium]